MEKVRIEWPLAQISCEKFAFAALEDLK